MERLEKIQIKAHIEDYLQKKVPAFQRKGRMFTCPVCGELSANIFPMNSYNVKCLTPECGYSGDIFKVARHIEYDDCKDIPDDDIAEELKEEFNIQTDNNVKNLLSKYYGWNWDLVPIANDSKIPTEKSWTTKNHKDIREWEQWLDNNSGLGVKTGNISSITTIDVDIITKQEAEIWQKGTAVKKIEEIKKKKEEGLKKISEISVFNETLMQDSGWKGVHFFYSYESDIPKSSFDYEGLHFDVENDGGYILIEPSTYAGKQRKIKGDTINKMSPELKELVLSQVKKPAQREEMNVESIDGDGKITGLDGKCNSTFAQVGGILRKFMNVKQMEQTLRVINKNMLDNPMMNKDLKGMFTQIERYHKADIETISSEIMEHMKLVHDAHVRDLKECLGYDRKDLEQALRFLCDHKKIYKTKKDLYTFIADVEWQEDFLSLGKPLDCKVPFLENYNSFDNGSMVVVGGASGSGKTHVTVNILKQIIDQNIYPYLISTEAGAKFYKIAQSLGIKEGEFGFHITNDPTGVPFKKNSVTIIDWLKPKNSEYAKTDAIYEKLNDKLVESGGLLIVLAQLRTENNSFYAEDMTKFYASAVAKIQYPNVNGVKDTLNPFLQTEKLRDSKVGKQYVKIPLQFNPDTKILSEKR